MRRISRLTTSLWELSAMPLQRTSYRTAGFHAPTGRLTHMSHSLSNSIKQLTAPTDNRHRNCRSAVYVERDGLEMVSAPTRGLKDTQHSARDRVSWTSRLSAAPPTLRSFVHRRQQGINQALLR